MPCQSLCAKISYADRGITAGQRARYVDQDLLRYSLAPSADRLHPRPRGPASSKTPSALSSTRLRQANSFPCFPLGEHSARLRAAAALRMPQGLRARCSHIIASRRLRTKKHGGCSVSSKPTVLQVPLVPISPRKYPSFRLGQHFSIPTE